MEDSETIRSYKSLVDTYKVETTYKVGFDKDVSEEAKEIITYLKGNLDPEDIVPGSPTALKIVLKRKSNDSVIAAFNQDSTVYNPAFDKEELNDFLNHWLEITNAMSGSNA